MMLTSAQVPNLAVRYWFLVWWGFSLSAKLVIKGEGVRNLLTFNLWSLDFHLETEWLITGWTIFCVATYCFITRINSIHLYHMSLWFPWLEWSLFLLKKGFGKCPYLWQDLHWNFLAGHWKPSMWIKSPHFWHLSCSCKHSWYQSTYCNGLVCLLYHSCDWEV